MSLNARTLGPLVLASLRTPRDAARAVMAFDLDRATRWQALFALVIVGSVLSVVATFLLTGQLGLFLGFAFATPLTAAIVQLSVTVMTVYAVYWIGRAMGGQGAFEDAILLVAWVQFVVICLQLVQLAAFLVLRPVSGLVDIVAAVVSVWMLVGFIAELHGFKSLLRVFVMVIATVFAMAFCLSLILAILGVSFPGVST